MFKLSSALPLFLRFFGYPRRRVSVNDDGLPATIDVYMLMLDDCAICKVRGDMDIAMSRAEPCAPIFEVEVIDLQDMLGSSRACVSMRRSRSVLILKVRRSRAGSRASTYGRRILSVGLTDN